jgi:hypothetical protein
MQALNPVEEPTCCQLIVRDNTNVTTVSVFINKPLQTQDEFTIPSAHRKSTDRAPDVQNWCSRHAMDVGDGQKRMRCIYAPVQRRKGIE